MLHLSDALLSDSPNDSADDDSEKDVEESDEEEEEDEFGDEGMELLLKEGDHSPPSSSSRPKKEISHIAATAESLQPKGYTLATTKVGCCNIDYSIFWSRDAPIIISVGRLPIWLYSKVSFKS